MPTGQVASRSIHTRVLSGLLDAEPSRPGTPLPSRTPYSVTEGTALIGTAQTRVRDGVLVAFTPDTDPAQDVVEWHVGVIHAPWDGSGLRHFMLREVAVARAVPDSPYILPAAYLAADQANMWAFIIFRGSRSLASLGLPLVSVQDMVRTNSRVPKHLRVLPEVDVVRFSQHLLAALATLHEHGVVHRNVNLINCAVDGLGGPEPPVLRLRDFVIARQVLGTTVEAEGPWTPDVVTLWWRPPELLLGVEEYGVAVDLWSAGVVLCELWRLVPMFPGHSQIETLFFIFQRLGTPSPADWPQLHRMPYWNGEQMTPQWRDKLASSLTNLDRSSVGGSPSVSVPPDHVALIRSLLVYDPRQRLPALRALGHAAFSSLPDVRPTVLADVTPDAADLRPLPHHQEQLLLPVVS